MAEGTNRRFRHSVKTTAPRAAIWQLWAEPATWGAWDRGLRSAAASGPLGPGVTGTIVDLAGRRASFRITEWHPGEVYAFATRLPLARLHVRRAFLPGPATRLMHEVHFSGPLAPLWARALGPGFRRALPPTMAELVRLAEAQAVEAGAQGLRA